MDYVYADKGPNHMVGGLVKMIKFSADERELETYYLQIFNYYNSLFREMFKYYFDAKVNWPFADYVETLNHETSSYGSTVINGLRNYCWYIREGKLELADEQRKRIIHFMYLFCIGVCSMEIAYYNLFK